MKSSSPTNPQKSCGGIPMRSNNSEGSSKSRELASSDGESRGLSVILQHILFTAVTVPLI
jgi:hypothetical protein